VTLLGLLCLLRGSDGLRVSVAHVDHGLRPTSAAEAELVTSLAAQLDAPMWHRRLQLDRGPALPARARQLRQGALIDAAVEASATWVALGHTQTDQAETVLLHLTRGAGQRGLSGMPTLTPWPPVRAGRVGHWLRPLLDLSREQTRALATHLRLPFVDDPTNDDRTAPRTRIRHEVLPQLAEINPAVERAIATAAEHARRADDALEQWARSELARRIRPGSTVDGADPVERVYDLSNGAALPQQVRWRLIRGACQDAGLASDALSAKTVQGIDAAWMEPGRPRSWDLRPEARVHIAGGRLWVARAAASAAPTIDPPKPDG